MLWKVLFVLLTIIRLILKVLFLPVRAVLHVLSFAITTLVGFGTIFTSTISGFFLIVCVVELFKGTAITDSLVIQCFVFGLLFASFPYIGAFIAAVPLAIAAFLKAITSAHPLQSLEDTANGIKE